SLGKQYDDGMPAAPAVDRAAQQDAASALATVALRAAAPDDQRAGVATRLNEWQLGFLEQLKGTLRQFNPGPPRIAELPPELRKHYVADDGTIALLIWPKEDLWHRDALRRFETEVEAAVRKVPGAPDVTGISSNVYHTTSA